MVYLVGTHSFLLAVELNKEWGVEDYTVIDTGHHYGLALCDGAGEFLAKRPATGGREVTIYSGEKPYSKTGARTVDGVLRSHQMAIANGGLYIANSGFNSVVFEDFSRGVRHEFHVNGFDYDHNHVNSVFPCADEVYVLLHNLRRLRPSQVLLLRHDINKGFEWEATTDLWHSGCHNVFVDDRFMFYNSSQNGEFVAVDLDSQQVVHSVPYSGHTKGLSVVGDHFVIGVSEHAERDARNRTRAYLSVIDRQDLAPIARIDLNFDDLPHPPGNVNEVRALSAHDEAHARQTALARDWGSLQLSRKSRFGYLVAASGIWRHGMKRIPRRIKRRFSRKPEQSESEIRE